MDLLGSESSEEDKQISFKINENYAKNYDKWRKKEERQKLIDKYGDVGSSDSSSEEEEIRSTPQMDKDWLRAYAVVRFQQPRLYKKGEKFFHDEVEPVIKHKVKATTLKDHERKFILKKGGVESDEETKPHQPQGKSYFEEQEEIKKSFKDALEESSDEDSAGENSGLLLRKQKTAEEKKREENEYLEWLKGERAELEDKEAAAELAPLREYWNHPGLSEKERVLRDYILNNGYMDQEESDEEEKDDGKDDTASSFDDEEEFLEKAEVYEHKYNFRHEEPGGDEIKSYPRVIETSVRTKDMRRADKRKRRLEKKNMERDQRRDEIKLLQKLQKEEKLEKLETLRKIANNPDLVYDLEADFDPNEHNKIMQKFFNEDYYGDTEDASQKPKFEYDADIDEEPDDWWETRLKEESQDNGEDNEDSTKTGQTSNPDDEDETFADDTNFIMDADYDPDADTGYKTQKKKNKKSNKKRAQKLPLFDPSTKTFDEYMDEYLKDKIDKLPFTYREVIPNDFGLSTEEILKANEKELNAWVSVKKMSAYRTKQDELADRRKFVARSTNMEKKRNMLPSLFPKPDEPSDDKVAGKKKRKRKKKAANSELTAPQSATSEVVGGAGGSPPTSENVLQTNGDVSEKPTAKTKKRKLSDINNLDIKVVISAAGISADKDQPKKKRKKIKKDISKVSEIIKTDLQLIPKKHDSQQQTDKCAVNGDIAVMKSIPPGNKAKKKKKKKHQKGDAEQNKISGNSGTVKKLMKKQKKKKLSISNFNSKLGPSADSHVHKKELERQLMKVMTASRLSKYGIGPNAVKSVGKRKKKKKVEIAQA